MKPRKMISAIKFMRKKGLSKMICKIYRQSENLLFIRKGFTDTIVSKLLPVKRKFAL